MSSYQRQICGQSSKKQNRKNSTSSKIVHIDAKKKTATSLINTGVMAVLGSIKCQRWDYNAISWKYARFPPHPIKIPSPEIVSSHGEGRIPIRIGGRDCDYGHGRDYARDHWALHPSSYDLRPHVHCILHICPQSSSSWNRCPNHTFHGAFPRIHPRIRSPDGKSFHIRCTGHGYGDHNAHDPRNTDSTRHPDWAP